MQPCSHAISFFPIPHHFTAHKRTPVIKYCTPGGSRDEGERWHLQAKNLFRVSRVIFYYINAVPREDLLGWAKGANGFAAPLPVVIIYYIGLGLIFYMKVPGIYAAVIHLNNPLPGIYIATYIPDA